MSAASTADAICATVAQRIRDARQKHGLSLQDVASRAGITKAHVWDLERGASSNPTIVTLAGLAHALEVPLAHLIGLPSPQPHEQIVDRHILREAADAAFALHATAPSEAQMSRLYMAAEALLDAANPVPTTTGQSPNYREIPGSSPQSPQSSPLNPSASPRPDQDRV